MKTLNEESIATVIDEFQEVELGDERLRKRVAQTAKSLAASPDKSFPRAMVSDAETEGFYRLMVNPRVSGQELLQPHFKATLERAKSAAALGDGTALCMHDTTSFSYQGERSGLGPISGKGQGYLAHVALVVANSEGRIPFGVGGVCTWAREEKQKNKTKRGHNVSGKEYAKREERESLRWHRTIESVEERSAGAISLIHVADREADNYELISALCAKDRRFVIRVSHDRRVEAGDASIERLKQAAVGAKQRCERTISLSRRKASAMPQQAKTFSARPVRQARLAFSACSIGLLRPAYRRDLPGKTQINLVYVQEVDPPTDEQPVEWLLATSESVSTVEEILRVVDIYRARWLIEEFFKALKTGCKLEKRQLESYEALIKAFALFVPIAWQMLLLRGLSRVNPEASAKEILSELQIKVLRGVAKRPLSKEPTIEEVVLAIARMGGHLKSNGPPGWLILARGMEELAQNVVGWRACEAALKM